MTPPRPPLLSHDYIVDLRRNAVSVSARGSSMAMRIEDVVALCDLAIAGRSALGLPPRSDPAEYCKHGVRWEHACRACDNPNRGPSRDTAPHFAIGTEVVLKSGGPVMTVADYRDGAMVCVWFRRTASARIGANVVPSVDSRIGVGVFAPETLEHAPC